MERDARRRHRDPLGGRERLRVGRRAAFPRGRLRLRLDTRDDRTLFFDLLPIDVGSIAGFNTRIQLYTVPGQVFYNTTRKLVLKGVDGVVFVADSQRPMLSANVESLRNLEENLGEMGLSLDTLPIVIQYNKRDLPDILSEEDIRLRWGGAPWPLLFAEALGGRGVRETFAALLGETWRALDAEYGLAAQHGLDAAAFVAAALGNSTGDMPWEARSASIATSI